MDVFSAFLEQTVKPTEMLGIKIEKVNARWQINGKRLTEATHIERRFLNEYFYNKRNQETL
tara:strand:- start:295 stop:477 length:183 start_codon:yes stop_codon:yes gene_type:complete